MPKEGTLSLKDLKKLNEQESAENNPVDDDYEEEEDQQSEPDEQDIDSDESSDDEQTDESEEDDSEEDEDGEKNPKGETEDWAKGDDEDDDSNTSLDSQYAKVRRKTARKYEGRLSQIEDENEKLRQELEAYKSGKAAPQDAPQQKLPPRPVRNQFQSEEDYVLAMSNWTYEVRDAQRKSQEIADRQRQVIQRQRETMSEGVDRHYLRASKLAEEAGISADRYKAADMRVRAAVEKRWPGEGDIIVDKLIAETGEGSERVFYNLGVNKSRLQEFVKSLEEGDGVKGDGIRTAVFLGEMKARLGAPTKRTSKAPEPPKRVVSDKAGGSMDAARRKYRDAMKSGDSQRAWDIKRSAKKAGADTSGW